jgi:hypothetical protein
MINWSEHVDSTGNAPSGKDVDLSIKQIAPFTLTKGSYLHTEIKYWMADECGNEHTKAMWEFVKDGVTKGYEYPLDALLEVVCECENILDIRSGELHWSEDRANDLRMIRKCREIIDVMKPYQMVDVTTCELSNNHLLPN